VIGTLFGLHPYVSPLRLFIEKQGLVELPEKADSGPMRRGRILESAVAAAVAEQRPEWLITKAAEYLRDPDLRLGCTPDFWITGKGILQAKTASPAVFQREWQDNRPPMWIILQAAVEMMLTDAAFGAVAVLVVDPHELPCHIYEIPRDAGTEDRIRAAVKKFWGDIAAGSEPSPDYGLDHDLIAALARREVAEKQIDLRGDNEIINALHERANAKTGIKEFTARCEAIDTMIMARMQDAAVGLADEFKITWKTEERAGYTVKPKSGRVLRVYDKRDAH
jgi:predicted phage-related endonuclease